MRHQHGCAHAVVYSEKVSFLHKDLISKTVIAPRFFVVSRKNVLICLVQLRSV